MEDVNLAATFICEGCDDNIPACNTCEKEEEQTQTSKHSKHKHKHVKHKHHASLNVPNRATHHHYYQMYENHHFKHKHTASSVHKQKSDHPFHGYHDPHFYGHHHDKLHCHHDQKGHGHHQGHKEKTKTNGLRKSLLKGFRKRIKSDEGYYCSVPGSRTSSPLPSTSDAEIIPRSAGSSPILGRSLRKLVPKKLRRKSSGSDQDQVSQTFVFHYRNNKDKRSGWGLDYAPPPGKKLHFTKSTFFL